MGWPPLGAGGRARQPREPIELAGFPAGAEGPRSARRRVRRPRADKAGPGDRRDLAEARRNLAAWLAKWSGKYSKLTGWVEENIDETLSFYRLPRQHHKHLKSTNALERLNEEIRRRTHVVRMFPNGQSCLRLVRALAVETHENWLEQHRYLNMDDLREHKKEALRRAA